MRDLRTYACLALQLFLAIGCEKQTDSTIDVNTPPPILVSASISPAVINSDTINVGPVRAPEDTLSLTVALYAKLSKSGDESVSSVSYKVDPPDFKPEVAEGSLFDDGNGLDLRKNDGIYSGRGTYRIKRVDVGVFYVSVTAHGMNGFASNTIILPLTVLRGNRPPVVADIEAADTVRLLNQSQFLTLRVRATDPDGLTDIARVSLNSFRPDGSPSSGNPFQMYDDGLASHGDDKSADGIFSLVITLPPSTQTGTYRFEFQATDRSDERSNTIIHRITVKQ